MPLTGEDVSGRGLVIFDFDGTLADTIPAITGTARRVLLAHGLAEGDLGDLTRLVGPPFPQAFSLVYGLSEDEAAKVTADYRSIYRSLGPEAWPLFPGVRELLGELRARGRRLAVCTSKHTSMVERALGDNGALGLFDSVHGKESDADGDKALVMRRVLSDLGAGPEEAVMVGDRRYDVEAALRNGLPAVGVRYARTCGRGELEDAGAASVAESVAELRRILLG